MRVAGLPAAFGLKYRHIAFRFLIDDRSFTQGGEGLGIFFVRSFTDTAYITYPANLLTHYRLSIASIKDDGEEVGVQQAGKSIEYTVGSTELTIKGGAFQTWDEAKKIIGVIDRAYALNRSGQIVVTHIKRPEWPIEPLDSSRFTTDFFSTAQLECGFQVLRPIPYVWLAPRVVEDY